MFLVYLLYNMCRFCPVLLNSAYKYILRNCELFHEIYYILVKKYTTLLINLVIYKEEFFVFSNIPAAPAYGVYISHIIRYSKACSFYQDVFDRGLLLRMNLLNQGFVLVRLKSSLLIMMRYILHMQVLLECC
jgi:hypothetical protein